MAHSVLRMRSRARLTIAMSFGLVLTGCSAPGPWWQAPFGEEGASSRTAHQRAPRSASRAVHGPDLPVPPVPPDVPGLAQAPDCGVAASADLSDARKQSLFQQFSASRTGSPAMPGGAASPATVVEGPDAAGVCTVRN